LTFDVKKAKKEIRERVWQLLEEKGVTRFPKPVYGRIPNFVGAEAAAERLFSTRLWSKAVVIKVNPDSPQKPVRYRALLDGKKVVMATPKLAQGFVLLDPATIPSSKYHYASTIAGALVYGKVLKISEVPKVDLVITGSVAVDTRGGRLGKGGGYGDLEYAILREIGVIDDNVYVATTIHDLQLIPDKIPREEHDLTVDAVFTPTKTMYVNPRPPKPRGVYWDRLGEKASLDIVRELREYLTRIGKR